MGWVDVKVEGGSGDGGVDISAARLSPSQHKEPIAIQVKRYRHPVGPRIVRELIGALGNGRFVKGFLVTTSEFTAQSQKAAASDVRIELVRGVDLVELLAKHGVALRYGAHGEIVRAS
jgi:restriction endonuclease Mrr